MDRTLQDRSLTVAASMRRPFLSSDNFDSWCVRGRRGGAPVLYWPQFGQPSGPAPAGFRCLCLRPLSLMSSASFGTAPERSRAQRGDCRNYPASGEFLQSRTLDGEDPFRILGTQGKGASNSLLPQADSSLRLAPRSVLSNDLRIQWLFSLPSRLSSLSLPPGFHTHSLVDSLGVRCRLVFD